jgi:broad specificity phosphatase PhoE
MAKKGDLLKVILIRHAESEENVRFRALKDRILHRKRNMPFRKALGVFKNKYRDCSITQKGELMADNIHKKIKNSDDVIYSKIDQYWYSPLHRTLQTMSKVFPEKEGEFKLMNFLHEMTPIETVYRRPFYKRVNAFKEELCGLDDDIKTIAVGGHGFFFKQFLGLNRRIKNTEVILCHFDKEKGQVVEFETKFLPDV